MIMGKFFQYDYYLSFIWVQIKLHAKIELPRLLVPALNDDSAGLKLPNPGVGGGRSVDPQIRLPVANMRKDANLRSSFADNFDKKLGNFGSKGQVMRMWTKKIHK